MHNYSLLIDCPDSYLDILRVFFCFLEKNWKTRNCTIYVSTQSKEIEHPDNVVFIKCGENKNCTERSLLALDYIQTKYIITIDCDDFIYYSVNNQRIDDLVDFMNSNNIKYVQIWRLKNKEPRKYKTAFKGLYFCNKKARYSKSLMANIWNKDEYINLFSSSKLDGWTLEGKWLKECFESEPGFYNDYCYCDYDPLNILHAVSKGCWIRKAYRKIIKAGIDKTMLSERKKLGFFYTFKFNLSMFLFNHVSSKTFLRIKRLSGNKEKYTTNY